MTNRSGKLPATTESDKFDEALTKILSVSHDELKRREAEWKKQRKAKQKQKKRTSK